jgi:hypothetical protein
MERRTSPLRFKDRSTFHYYSAMFPVHLLSEESIELIPVIVSLFPYSLVTTPVALLITGMTKHFTFNTSRISMFKFSISFQPPLYYIPIRGYYYMDQ